MNINEINSRIAGISQAITRDLDTTDLDLINLELDRLMRLLIEMSLVTKGSK